MDPGHRSVAEDLAPTAEGLVGGDDDLGPLIASGDGLEEEVGRLGLKGDVAHLVDDEEGDAPETGELVVEPALGVGLAQSGHPLGGGGEGDAVAGLAGP
jgi:hypothetical protein